MRQKESEFSWLIVDSFESFISRICFRVYNQRRRLRALGLDPDMPKGSFIDNEAIREHIKMANAKKAEAARLR